MTGPPAFAWEAWYEAAGAIVLVGVGVSRLWRPLNAPHRSR
jgi:hypothetical protein